MAFQEQHFHERAELPEQNCITEVCDIQNDDIEDEINCRIYDQSVSSCFQVPTSGCSTDEFVMDSNICMETKLSTDHQLQVENNQKSKTDFGINTNLNSKNLPFVCGICNFGFPQEETLLEHVRQHMKDDSFKCETCGKKYLSKKDLSCHITKQHQVFKWFSCEVCDKVFSRNHSLKIHLRMHTGEQPYVCNICQRGFNRKDILDKHMKTHNEKVFVCEICSKSFDRKANLTAHSIIHAGEGLGHCNIKPA